ncbi:NAD(P)-dependent oxidoreductase [Pontibacter sp. 172403-2]|uniref:NAD-dependent epimerase/dehydratase family protein n=1 Tax=Pontibacter rufus TaxID=2791028 RepID=UPI0018AFB64E|nr:NAD(P)-dependent oxidoreductase [Pontibacter sp. 172403-2]MBF9252186.1 NAD(P)-dependent oxidoreductase [Pontibacter sp. 172403-2]
MLQVNNEIARKSEKEVILVTGSSGLIGSALIKKLAPRYQMVGFDNAGYPYPPEEADCITIDLTSEENLAEVMDEVQARYGKRIASVVHLAAYYDFAGRPSPLYEKITVQGTQKLLKALQPLEVQQFIFSSSLLVYAPTHPGVKINENSPLEPKWDYPKSKVKTEKLIHENRGNIPAVILRIAGVYDEEGNSIPLTNQIQRIYEKQLTSHFYPGNTAHGNPFIHLDDLVEAIAKTIERRKDLPAEVTINIGDPETLSYRELQQQIGRFLYGKAWRTYRIPKVVAKLGAWAQGLFGDPFIKPWMIDLADDHSELDITRARTLLGWEPRHSLRETLPKMIAALKADPAGWYRRNKLK